MAGGPSTPELAAALASQGATGFLAGGMKSAEKLVENYRSTVALRDTEQHGSARTAQSKQSDGERDAEVSPDAPSVASVPSTPGVIGVNLFVPEPANTAIPQERKAPGSEARARRRKGLEVFRETLLDEAAERGVELPEVSALDPDVMDDWDAKLDAAVAEGWPLVTFSFGLPVPEVFDRLRAAGTLTGVTVTNPAEAQQAVNHGADFLVVQGPTAGGHRSTHDPQADPDQTTLTDLIPKVQFVVGLEVPLVAAGGIMTAKQAAPLLTLGAKAVQCGTAFLRCPEAGTNPTHRLGIEQAVARMNLSRTGMTRAFSGRWARGVVNRFQTEHDDAPAAYPEVNVLTGPLKSAAQKARDVEGVNLWAGSGVAQAQEKPAAEVLADLLS